MTTKIQILACAILALTLTGCSLTPTRPPQLDSVTLPSGTEIPQRLPEKAMQPCKAIPAPEPISVLEPTEQSTAIVNYVLTLYGGYADCFLRHQELKEWINENK